MAERLLDHIRETLPTQHDALHTENACLDRAWLTILFHHKHHPKDISAAENEAALTHLAVERDVVSSTHITPALTQVHWSASREGSRSWGRRE